MINTDKRIPLKDFRYVTNKILYKKIKMELMEQLRRMNNPKFEFFSQELIVFVDFNNIGYIDVLYPIQGKNIDKIAIGSFTFRVKFLKVKTIDEVFEAYTFKEDSPFTLKAISYFFYQNEEDFTHRFYFIDTINILYYARKLIFPKKNDKLINVKADHLKNTYIGYQNANNLEYLEIYEFNNPKEMHLVTKIKIDELIQNKSDCHKSSKINWFHNFFNTSKRNGKKYEKIAN